MENITDQRIAMYMRMYVSSDVIWIASGNEQWCSATMMLVEISSS